MLASTAWAFEAVDRALLVQITPTEGQSTPRNMREKSRLFDFMLWSNGIACAGPTGITSELRSLPNTEID
jgi:hypothetical protein